MVLIQFLIRCATYAAGNVLRQAQEAHRERGAGQQNIGAVGGAGQSTPPVRPTVTASTAAAPTPTGQADTDHRLRAAIAGGDGAKIMEALLRGEDVNTDRPGGMDYAGLTRATKTSAGDSSKPGRTRGCPDTSPWHWPPQGDTKRCAACSCSTAWTSTLRSGLGSAH
jgi:hypothetical protein